MDPYSKDQQPYNNFSKFTPPPHQPPPRTNGKSIAAMVLGICSLVIPYLGLIIGIVAIVFASISFKEIKRTGEQGKGMAIAGLVCGIIGTALYALIIIIIILVVVVFNDSSSSFINSFDNSF
ncbi:DUF4190 domain-containing protein [Paenibacillus eucommiae]|uniref:Membrane protein n=1 Tax=Paenibacillus eucommiae TaxID=1355755 RepID=A0ABS4IV59_9BACL|nr:DUF4190 domain-containing protein [Paenibacillus eucommiae]MBP1991470.1 putative membrane protein [Paenibacillus eucommiae]